MDPSWLSAFMKEQGSFGFWRWGGREYVHLHVYVHVQAREYSKHVCTCVERSEVNLGCHSSLLLVVHFVFEMGSATETWGSVIG